MSRGETQHIPSKWEKKFSLCTDRELAQLVVVIGQIENDTSPDGFNKHRLPPLPFVNNIKWPFQRGTHPKDVDKAYNSNKFNARFHTMDTLCDPHHVTTESPATLYIEYVIQHFETGGRCPTLGMPLTHFLGTIRTYSFGRPVTQRLDQTDKTKTREVTPGEHMKTGCTVLLPTNIHEHYDITRRCLVIESWTSNSMRYDFIGGE